MNRKPNSIIEAYLIILLVDLVPDTSVGEYFYHMLSSFAMHLKITEL